MTQRWKELLLVLALGLGAPWLILGIGAAAVPRETAPATTAPQTTAAEEPERIRVLTGEGVAELELESYLTGVVLGEMPGSFPMEAKKAQAVVARTYALRTAQTGKHETASVCTDPGCCQAYTDPEGFIDAGGELWIAEEAAVAVRETAAEVLTYQGALIEATYFSCSGGMTEDAVAVWGTDVPYLQAVESPGEELAEHYTDTVSFTALQFQQALSTSLSGSPEGWFTDVTYADGGGVATMRIGDTVYTGTELRQLLGLRSTAFAVRVEGDSIEITTKGYGHRVGMSQYGAQAMALGGSGYDEILAHYYQGTVLEKSPKG